MSKADKLLKLTESLKDRIGRCYELSYKFITSHFESDMLLVHGFASDPSRTNRINHAWIEKGNGMVFDPVMDQELPKIVYYKMFHAEPDHKYTRQEALHNAIDSGQYGPWNELDTSKINIPDTRAGKTVDELDPIKKRGKR
jgi:hypothetical protein